MANKGQAQVWNATVAEAWIRYADEFDVTLDPFGRAVMDKLELRAGERVLDIGCGVGATTIDLAARVAPGQVRGADISHPMLTEAERRAAEQGVTNVDFVEVDAQTADFGDVPFDVAFSRVGVMFFEDPTAAFMNIASHLSTEGRLGFICFQSPRANPFFVIPALTAAQHLELPPPPPRGRPGPFSLADPDVIRQILTSAGFTDITIEPGPTEAVIPGADELDSVALRLIEQNPATAVRITQLAPEEVFVATNAVAEALAPFRDNDVLRMDAGTWVVLARVERT